MGAAVNVLLMLAHSIEEHDQLKLLHGLGYTVASIGGYIDPAHPHDDVRPALPHIPRVDVVWDAVQEVEATETRPDRLINAKDNLPQAIIDWADVLIVHHMEWRWIGSLGDDGRTPLPGMYGGEQWSRIRDKRVIWRTVGQSSHDNEARMKRYRDDGLEIVRYSPKEENIPGYLGKDALIRFYMDPDEWHGWTGEDEVVTNVTQDLVRRGAFCGLDYWQEATRGLPTRPGGPGSEQLLGGVGKLPLDDMKALLRKSRVYMYTGTVPASYTLGLLEAMMTGIPIVSVGPANQNLLPYFPRLFEGHELAAHWSDTPETARMWLRQYLKDWGTARETSRIMRDRAIGLFGKASVGAAWKAYLG